MTINDQIDIKEDIDLITARIEAPNTDMLGNVAELQCLLSFGVMALDLTVPQQETAELQRTEDTLRQFLHAAAENGNPQPGYGIG